MLVAIVFIVTLVIGVPIAFMLGLAGFSYIFVIDPSMATALPQKLFSTASNYSLLAIPLFLLAGELMELSGDVDRLTDLSKALVGQIKGGMAYVLIILGFLLGGPLGSANAEAALLSSTLFKDMKTDGYNEEFLGGLIASVSVIGPLIPPGMLMVIYGVASGASIKDLFMAGVMPGVYLAIGLGIVVYFIGRKQHWPTTEWGGWDQVWIASKRAFLSIASPLLVLVSIAFGIATPTEAASVASVLTLLIGIFIYRKIKIKDLIPIFLRTGAMSGAVLIIGAMGGVLGWTLALDQVPQMIAAFVVSLTTNKYIILLLINIFLLIVGMLMDATPAVMILVPIFMPLINQFHFDPIHFGLMVCFNLTIGLLTPPVGTVLYTTSAATGVPANKMIKSIWPWVLVCIAILLLVTYIPESIMWLPHILDK